EEAEAFLAMVNGFEPERVKYNWTLVRNSTMNMTFFASAKINEVWQPLTDGKVYIYILDGHNVKFDPTRIARYDNGDDMIYEVEPDENGWGNVSILVPSSLANFQLYIAIAGGQFDALPQPIEGREWNFTVAPPQTIRVDNSTSLSSNPVIVGTAVTVQGYVRYIYTHGGVEGAEVTISGQHISTTNGRTNQEGRFSINFQAPIQVSDDLVLTIRAEDPRTGEVDTLEILYDVVPPIDDEEEETGIPVWLWALIIGAVLAFAIAFGAVMMYRRHYGEVVECGECGAFISASSSSCPKCGIEFETDLARCSECEAWIPANSSACPVCGTAFTIESLEEQVAREEAEEEVPTIDQVTTSTATVAPLALDTASDAKWGDREKRRRRIKKRVKKRLTVTDTVAEEPEEEEPSDLFIGEDTDSTRLPGLEVDESSLGDEDLSRLLPTEDMLKDLMLTTDEGPAAEETEAIEPEGELDLEEVEPEEAPEAEPDVAPAEGLELEEVSLEEVPMEDIPAPEEPEELLPEEEPETPDLEPEAEEDEGAGSKELLSELGLVAEKAAEVPEEEEDEGTEDEGSLTGLLAEDEDSKEAPKLCPNCGGNWILYKDGEYTCRICGENW
nr:zinc ribbon domain-containing protein [Thermoplasmata archaeon]NIS11283.1 zinc ribbon domain-containing protein [Thermoplasmata archaeon]NIS19221.1 zinc ribbon domain-containing protein [Thermoplasmata archaeon]NIT76286.1 zinc ribbon domain-containing protein [Thermoplasmata archaeon]NIU48353.1 zinc ribbon domain-containing protein [Thermoplasmata archaeon]